MDPMIRTMMDAAVKALPNAYAPYSHFTVGSCICTEDHSIFTGVNVENCSYGLSVCAETSAICQMVAAGKRTIEHMVVLAGHHQVCSPCGGCRQRIYEFSTPKTKIYVCNHETIVHTFTADELLPIAFHLTSTRG